MSATRYRRFLKLCEEWPKDEAKKGRDLGTFLRQRVASAFREGENTQVTTAVFFFFADTAHSDLHPPGDTNTGLSRGEKRG